MALLISRLALFTVFIAVSWVAVVSSALCDSCTSEESPSRTVLVLVEDMRVEYTHSIFFGSLRDYGFELTFKFADENDIVLIAYGEPAVDHLILFAPSVETFGSLITAETLAQYVDLGGNVLVAASSDILKPLREFAALCGIEFDAGGSAVIDNFHHLRDDNTLVIADDASNTDIFFGDSFKGTKDILFRGVGHRVAVDSPLVLPVLSAQTTAYSFIPEKAVIKTPKILGASTRLVSAMQARNNARVIFSGSLDMFSDDFFTSQVNGVSSGNEEFALNCASWAFQVKGVLRFGKITHHLVGETAQLSGYTMKTNVYFSVEIEERNETGHWNPYTDDGVTFALHRLDPFYRRPLTSVGGSGVFETELRMPDVYGIFQFQVTVARRGYSFLSLAEHVNVLPLRHDQYERFLFVAYPYYTSSISMIGGLLLFSFVFLYHKDNSKTKTE